MKRSRIEHAVLAGWVLLVGCGGGTEHAPSDALETDAAVDASLDAPLEVSFDGAADGDAASFDAKVDETKCLPFDMPAAGVLAAAKKKVFAHYFSPFPLSLDNKDPSSDYYTVHYLSASGEGGKFQFCGGYLRNRPLPQAPLSAADWQTQNFEKEIRTARAMGVDGFTFDMLSTTGTHWDRLQKMLQAVERSKTNFKIVLMPDMYATFTETSQLVNAVTSLAKEHPSVLFKLGDGRLVLSPYGAEKRDNAWWASAIASLEAAGVQIAFVPLFSNVPWATAMKAMKPAVPMYGVAAWGARTPTTAAAYAKAASTAHAEGLVWMAPIAPQDMRPKELVVREAKSSLAFRIQWNDAIADDADWVQLITWNDYSEATEVAPSLRTQWGYADLATYYAVWFKTGAPPKIVRDRIVYFHRVHSTSAKFDATKQTGGPFQFKDTSTPAANEIEMVAFLKAPAKLEIEIGGKVERRDAPAGLTSFTVPLSTGKPIFRIVRDGVVVQEVASAFPIVEAVTYQDLLYRAGGATACTRD